MAHWLASSGRPVAHDFAIHCDKVDTFLEGLDRGLCCVETGAIDAWRLMRHAFPEACFVTVRRPVSEVYDSLRAHGADPCIGELLRRDAELDALQCEGGVLSVQYSDLANPKWCSVLWERCHGVPFDWPRWLEFETANIQVRMSERLAFLAEHAGRIADLKTDVAERLRLLDEGHPAPFISVRMEPWREVSAECEALGRAHHREAWEGHEGDFELNVPALNDMADRGLFMVCTARVNSQLAGYCTWTREINVESTKPLTAVQGGLYVDPAFKKFNLGKKMLDASKAELSAAGYKLLDFHHTMFGRGARAGALYERMGAVESQRHYTLRIGD